MRIVFAIGYEDGVAILDHPCGPESQNADIDALYSDMEQGHPEIKKHSLIAGVYHGEFGAKGLSDIHIVKRHWNEVA